MKINKNSEKLTKIMENWKKCKKLFKNIEICFFQKQRKSTKIIKTKYSEKKDLPKKFPFACCVQDIQQRNYIEILKKRKVWELEKRRHCKEQSKKASKRVTLLYIFFNLEEI